MGLTINALRTSEVLAKELTEFTDSEQQRISIKLLPSQRKLYEKMELDVNSFRDDFLLLTTPFQFYEASNSRKPSLVQRYNRQLHNSVPHLHSVVQLVRTYELGQNRC